LFRFWERDSQGANKFFSGNIFYFYEILIGNARAFRSP
tara:strand:+ start:94 stop:207 length:114 start_codon:yes stop_codon:yes gene_type:complete